MYSTSIYLDEKYCAPRNQIRHWRKKGKSWEFLKCGCGKDLESFIADCNDFYDWDITTEEWTQLIITLKDIEDNSYVGFVGDPKVQLKPISEDDGSAWQKYKHVLVEKAFSAVSIDNIERASQKVASQLKLETDQKQPIRGMVVGNVQSGKTANMAGVISMAEDFGFNFFIVLSGTIDNLRKQTQDRLVSDLNSANSNLNFKALPPLSGKTESGFRLQDLNLNDGDKDRYLYVCLKNTTRLKDLLVWLNQDKAKKQKLKIVLLDDEADQAGVNTANMDRNLISKINRQIKAVVFGQNYEFIDSTPYCSMNYIGYTATPYANFLNEANDASLYPCNFILTLNSPEEYIGPQQIFGLEDVNIGLPIVNVIKDDEVEEVNNMACLVHNIPSALKESIHWFICTVACFRYWKLGKPVSMLIHTSQIVAKHDYMAKIIADYVGNLAKSNYIPLLEDTYRKQKKKLNIERFREEMPDFPKEQKINNYPEFNNLIPFLKEVVDIGTQHILLDEEETKFEYGLGLHLCVDNYKNNRILDENMVLRLIYPDRERDNDIIKKSPAFIVVGGATLSRGLTLEGLTTSYFLRSTVLADALMQMGRWFGFRKKYELLPRLWFSNRTIEQFKFLTVLDTDLREELHNMESLGQSPKEYAPRLDTFPGFKLLQATSKNKRQKAYEIEQDFSNKKGQTTKFYGDDETIIANYNHSRAFINKLGPLDKSKILSLNNYYSKRNKSVPNLWFDVPYQDVIELLGKLKYPHQSALIIDKDETMKWFKNQHENGYLENFHVLLASNVEGGDILSFDNNIEIHMPTRRQLKEPKGCDIDLKVISYPNDRLLDIDMSRLDNNQIDEIVNSKNLNNVGKRIKYGLANTPLLILYFINKDSGKNEPDTEDRISLNLVEHLVGYYIYIPYGNNGAKKKTYNCNKMVVELDFLRSDVEDEDAN